MKIGNSSSLVPLPGNNSSPLASTDSTRSAASAATDTFQSAKGGGAGNLVTAFLDIRVPTTTHDISEQEKKEILAKIQPGDIVLETNNAYPHWQKMEYFTMRSAYTHAFMYEGLDKDGNPMHIEATTGDPTGKGVVRNNFKDYLEGPIKIAVIRPKYKTEADRQAALDYCRDQLGKPYNTRFNMQDKNSLYCAELVYFALKAGPNPIDAPLIHVAGRDAVAPDSFLKIGGENVHGDHTTFWKNESTHLPVIAPAVAFGATALSMSLVHGVDPLTSVVVGVGTGLAGLTLAVLTGNKIQTGHFNLAGGAK